MNKYFVGRWMVMSLCVVLALGVVSGCKHKKPQPINTEITSNNGPENTSGEGQPDLDLEKIIFDKNNPHGLQTIYFDYDSSSLRPDALSTLRDNAEKLKKVPNVLVQIAGHCDERGTQEYNLALGERRALAVRDHLIQLGISGDRLVTISYGEEDPAVPGHDESAWSKNRRCEFNSANR